MVILFFPVFIARFSTSSGTHAFEEEVGPDAHTWNSRVLTDPGRVVQQGALACPCWSGCCPGSVLFSPPHLQPVSCSLVPRPPRHVMGPAWDSKMWSQDPRGRPPDGLNSILASGRAFFSLIHSLSPPLPLEFQLVFLN